MLPLPVRVVLATVARPRPRRHGYGGGLRSQAADLRLPPGPGPHPVAVLVHGGSWRARYGKLVMGPLARDLVQRGWAAWNIEYRRLGRGQGGGWPATFDDVAAAVDALADLADPRLDLDRVAVVGHSAGGQLALWAGGRAGLPPGAPGAAPRVVARAVVALAAVSDMVSAGEPAQDFLGGRVEQVPERYAQADPMRRIPLGVPVLLVHAEGDPTVPVARSRAYAESAREAGAGVTLVVTEGGTHRDPIDPAGAAWRAAGDWLAGLAISPRG